MLWPRSRSHRYRLNPNIQEARHSIFPPYRNMERGSVAASAASQGREGVGGRGGGGTLNNAVQVSCGLLYQLRSKPSSDLNY